MIYRISLCKRQIVKKGLFLMHKIYLFIPRPTCITKSCAFATKWVIQYLLSIFFTLLVICPKAQTKAIIEAASEKRMQLFWSYCTQKLISDRDSLMVHRFLDEVIDRADKIKDHQLMAYAQYFKKCWRILFSEHYEQYFPEGYQHAVDILNETATWAMENGHPDIAASCNNYIGQIYYRANRYGLAFEHLLEADEAFEKIRYQRVPNAASYLYTLGLYFYRFAEYDKALQKFLQATNYAFYLPREEINTLNAIGLIYARQNKPDMAIRFFKNTMDRAKQIPDTTWIGISAGNLGNILMDQQKNDSALYYHRINYALNGHITSSAPEDGAKTSLSIATILIRKNELDSAIYYVYSGKELAGRFIIDSTEHLDYEGRLLNVLIDYSKVKGDFQRALLLTDSLSMIEQELTSRLDSKILSRAIEKTEAISYTNELKLLKSQKDLAQWRFYFIIATLLAITIFTGLIYRNKLLHKKRQVQLAEKDNQILLAEKLRAEDGLKHAQELLKTYIDTIKEKTIIIEQLESELVDFKKITLHTPELMTLTSNREKLMASTILTDKEWQQFRLLFEQVYPGFSYRLKVAYPELSPAEIRFFYLIKLSFSSREMATMLGISIDSIHKLRYRLRKKLNLEEVDNFETVVQNIN
jgi:DNA-binding CsgD family transcriptional regulator